MSVRVVTREGVDSFPLAAKWHIDQFRTLHIVGAGGSRADSAGPFSETAPAGNVASYAEGAWESVFKEGELPELAPPLEYLHISIPVNRETVGMDGYADAMANLAAETTRAKLAAARSE